MAPKLPKMPETVPAFTRAVQDYYLRTDPKTGALVENAEQAQQLGLKYSTTFVYPNLQNYPGQVLALIDWFDRIDAQTAAKLAASDAKYYGSQVAAAFVPHLIPLVALGFFDDTGPTRENIATAFDRWQQRKDNYRQIVQAWRDSAPDPFTNTPAREAYATDVGGPLFLGWYPGRDAQTTLDAATPLMLARMLGVAQAAMAQAWDQFIRDLTLADARDKLSPSRWPEWLPWAAGGVALLAVGGLGWAAYRSARGARLYRGGGGRFTEAQLRKGTAQESREHSEFPEAVARQIARDHLEEDPAYYGTPGNPHAACGAAYGKLHARDVELMPRAAFGLPAERKYPMPDSSHAKNAKARAAQQLRVWKRTNGVKGLSPAKYRLIVDKADRIIKQCENQESA